MQNFTFDVMNALYTIFLGDCPTSYIKDPHTFKIVGEELVSLSWLYLSYIHIFILELLKACRAKGISQNAFYYDKQEKEEIVT